MLSLSTTGIAFMWPSLFYDITKTRHGRGQTPSSRSKRRQATRFHVYLFPFQTHYFSENLAAPGIEPGTSGSAARKSNH
jgi:hypothetical protein